MLRIGLLTASAFVIIAAYAYAQPSPQLFNLQVDAKEVDLIGKALSGMPYADVAPLMAKLQTQIQVQLKPPPAPLPVNPKPEVKE